jgi:hypothetical protein
VLIACSANASARSADGTTKCEQASNLFTTRGGGGRAVFGTVMYSGTGVSTLAVFLKMIGFTPLPPESALAS